MPEIKEIFNGFLSKTLNMDETAVASLYNEDGTLKDDSLQTLLSADVERVSKLKPNTDAIFKEARAAAKGEVMKNFEKEFKEKTGFKSEKIGIDLVLDYAATQAKQTGTLSEDDIKKHPLFISTVDKLEKEKQLAIEAESEKLSKFQTELKVKETFSGVSQKALSLFDSFKPILSKDSVKAENQKNDFVNKLKSYEFDIQGDKIIVMKDGKVVEDAHGNRIPFEKIVKQTAEQYYDFHVAEPRTSAANNSSQAGSSKTVEVPKTESEYAKMIADTSIPVEDRMAIKEAYQKQN